MRNHRKPSVGSTRLYQPVGLMKTLLLCLLTLAATQSFAAEHKGFNTGDLQVVEIDSPEGQIESLLSVTHKPAKGAWTDDTYIVGAVINDQAIAYPLAILLRHWIINDTVENKPVLVVFCRLCGSAAIYNRSAKDQVLTFGSSSLIYEDDVLLFDNQTKSLWSWADEVAVAGPLASTKMLPVSGNTTTLGEWIKLHPESLIATVPADTTDIDYQITPNNTSARGESVYSGLIASRAQIHPATPVVGVSKDDQIIAIPATEVLGKDGGIKVIIDKETLTVAYDTTQQTFVTSGNVEITKTDLRGWMKKHPTSSIYTSQKE